MNVLSGERRHGHRTPLVPISGSNQMQHISRVVEEKVSHSKKKKLLLTSVDICCNGRTSWLIFNFISDVNCNFELFLFFQGCTLNSEN